MESTTYFYALCFAIAIVVFTFAIFQFILKPKEVVAVVFTFAIFQFILKPKGVVASNNFIGCKK
jgi:hypothetical protein